MPDWAFPDLPVDPSISDEEDENPALNDQSTTDESNEDADSKASNDWRNAKGSMTRCVGGNGERFSNAAQSYVKAKGGGKRAAAAAVYGRASTVAIGRFLTDVVSHNTKYAIQQIGLEYTVGQDVDTVLAGIVNALAPDGAALETSAARMAVNDVLDKLFLKFVDESDDITSLDQLSANDVCWALKQCVISYVYNRWLQELGQKIEAGAVSPTNAINLEKQMYSYIEQAVNFDIKEADMLTLDWTGEKGQAIVGGLFQEAYSFLEVYEE